MAKIHNVNELLEKKKYLEQQIAEKTKVENKDLVYVEETVTDRLNPENNRKNVAKKKVSLNDFSKEFNGMVEELAQTKTAIQRYNAGDVLELLQGRNAVRTKIQFLTSVKATLPTDMRRGREVLSQDDNKVPIEVRETVVEPMFELGDVEKQLNELSAKERELNTEIQKLNLNAKITL